MKKGDRVQWLDVANGTVVEGTVIRNDGEGYAWVVIPEDGRVFFFTIERLVKVFP